MSAASALPTRRLHPLSKYLALLVLVGAAMPVVTSKGIPLNPISCERHQGDFTNEFNPHDFDVSSITCKLAAFRGGPEMVIYPGDRTYGEIVWASNRD